jgi:succinyl-diaminopimelate desuccinylase
MSELLDHLRALVAFRTTADRRDEKEKCLAWIEETFLASQGQRAMRGAIDGAPYVYVPSSRPSLLWFAHIDVVPGPDALFTLSLDGDRARGRGAKDMKGAALTLLLAYRDFCKDGRDSPVSLLLTSDEEIAGPSVPELLKKKIIAASAAYTPDNGGDSSIIVEHKGVVWTDLTVHGGGGHGAYPWASANPIPRLAEILLTLEKNFPCGTKDDWRVTVTPTQLTGSSARNSVPNNASCGIDIRYPPELCSSADEVLALISAHLPKDCTLTPILTQDPLSTDPKHPLVQQLKRIATKILAADIPLGREHGASDARHFPKHGIPAFLYGPIGEGVHGIDEWVSVSSLEQHVEIYREWLTELAASR